MTRRELFKSLAAAPFAHPSPKHNPSVTIQAYWAGPPETSVLHGQELEMPLSTWERLTKYYVGKQG